MTRKLIIAGVVLVVFAGPVLAVDWYVIKPVDGFAPPEAISSCVVVDRPAAAGEEQIAGPYTSQQAGLNARHRYAACDAPRESQ